MWSLKQLLAIAFALIGIYVGYVMVRCTLNEVGCIRKETKYFFTWYALEDPFELIPTQFRQ